MKNYFSAVITHGHFCYECHSSWPSLSCRNKDKGGKLVFLTSARVSSFLGHICPSFSLSLSILASSPSSSLPLPAQRPHISFGTSHAAASQWEKRREARENEWNAHIISRLRQSQTGLPCSVTVGQFFPQQPRTLVACLVVRSGQRLV